MPWLSQVAVDVFNLLAERAASGLPPGVPTNLPEVDALIGGGWPRQQLVYLVGDSGVGKTWLALAWATYAAQWLLADSKHIPAYSRVQPSERIEGSPLTSTPKEPIIVIWSLEMPATPLVARMITQAAAANEAYIDSSALLRGEIGVDGVSKQIYDNAFCRLMSYGQKVFVDFDSTSISEFRDTLALLENYDICLILIDYFRLINESTPDGMMSSVQAERSQKLKAIAKDYDACVLSIFDINREGQKAKASQTYHMRGGVAANYDADLILVLNRCEDDKQEGRTAKTNHHLELVVAKGRYVPTGSIELYANWASGTVELWRQPVATVYTKKEEKDE